MITLSAKAYRAGVLFVQAESRVAEKTGNKTKLARLGKDHSRLAEKIHAKQKSISRYETGAVLSVETLLKSAKVLK